MAIKARLASIIDRLIHKPVPKLDSELEFWRGWFAEHGSEPETEYYRKFMMDMGNVADAAFFDDKICLDIGCGPKGSLTWLTNVKVAIGLDPLADRYMEFGVADHNMIYLQAESEKIPLPGNYVDIVFSMNSLDHVDNLDQSCKEIRRVLKKGGYLIGSFNLNEPKTVNEPWTLTESILEEKLFQGWSREYYEIRPKLNSNEHFGPYRYFYEECSEELRQAVGPKALWCRFKKK